MLSIIRGSSWPCLHCLCPFLYWKAWYFLTCLCKLRGSSVRLKALVTAARAPQPNIFAALTRKTHAPRPRLAMDSDISPLGSLCQIKARVRLNASSRPSLSSLLLKPDFPPSSQAFSRNGSPSSPCLGFNSVVCSQDRRVRRLFQL